jgi:hypothetical protein
MKKNIVALGLLLVGIASAVIFSQAYGGYIANNLTVKHAGDLSEGTSIIAGSSDDTLDFTMNIIVDGSQPNRKFRV